ncbi:MAG: hypothetical protein ACOZBW_11295 [Thermodesulfobacteriota bacterium]
MTTPIRIFTLTLGMMVFLLATGCATVGKDFSSSAAETIVINKTTIDDIRNMLGEPWRTGIEDGLKTWTYGYYQYRLFGPSDTKDLIIRFNADNTVASYTFNTTR